MSGKKSSDNLNDSGTANAAILYLLFTLGFFSWLLFDTWVNAHTLFRVVGYWGDQLELLKTELFHLVAYTVIGGAIGGIINGLRSALLYYGTFNRHYFWKYIAAPWMGAALALIGFAILRSTVAIFGGDGSNAAAGTPQFLANFGLGALAGYGSKDVFIWLDEQVSKLFAVKKPTPDVTGQPQPVAESQIQSGKLAVGATATTPAKTPEEEGVVVDQVPAAGTPIDLGKSVDIVVAAKSDGETPPADG